MSFLSLEYVWCFGGLLLSGCCFVTQLQYPQINADYSYNQLHTALQSYLLTHCIDGSSIRHETKGVLENATCMEQRQGDAHDFLQPFLCPPKPGSSWVFHLIKHFILPKREDRHQMSAGKVDILNEMVVALINLFETLVFHMCSLNLNSFMSLG